MAIGFVSRVEGFGSAAAAGSRATAAQAHTAANTLVCCVSVQNSNSITIANTAGDTWTSAGSAANNANYVRIFYASSTAGHATDITTATLSSGTGNYFQCVVYEFSGCDTTGALDGSAVGTSGNSTSLSSGSITVTAASAVIVALMEADGQSLVAGTGYSLTLFNGGSGDGRYFADEYHIVSASESASATCASGSWVINGASFKVASGGGGGTTPRFLSTLGAGQ